MQGQDYLFDIENINLDQGLPNRSAFAIAQDSEGFIWVSTLGKISRYDGYKFKSYEASFLNVSDNQNIYITFDTNNYLWYCQPFTDDKSSSGIINTQTDSIYSIAEFSKGIIPSSSEILKINGSQLNKGTIFITTKQGEVYKYNGEFEKIYQLTDDNSSRIIYYEELENYYWLMSENKFLKINQNQELVQTYPIKPKSHTAFKLITAKPNLIFESRNQVNEKLYWELKNNKLVPYHTKKNIEILQLTDDLIYSIADNSIVITDTLGNIKHLYDKTEFFGSALKYIDTFIDNQNILWVSTGNGLYKIIRKQSPFRTLEKNNSIRGIYKDGSNLYIGGYTRNVLINSDTGNQFQFLEDRTTSVSFALDKHNQLWIGSIYNELYKYDRSRLSFELISHKYDSELNLVFYDSIVDRLWIGSTNGLKFLDQKSNTIESYNLLTAEVNIIIRDFYQNDQGLWIATNKGLFLMDPESETIIEHYSTSNGMPFNNLNHIYEDKNGVFWLATKEGGLIQWYPKTAEFKQFTTQDGLSNNTIYAVYEDDYNNLWLPSNFGLMRFNKGDKNVRVYLPENGIAHEEFNTFAHFQDTEGTLYFGGLNGVTIFHPKDLKEDSNLKVPLKLTELKILNQKNPKFEDKTSSFYKNNKIVLSPTDRVLKIEVSALDFEHPNEVQYLYQIEGHQDQWVYTRSNILTFNNLPYGEYIINVKSKGMSSGTASEMLQIPVVVKKPFYLTWQFLTIFGICFLLFGVFILKWRVSKLEKDRERLELEIIQRTKQIEADKKTIAEQAENLKQLDVAKTRFYSNLTHEFRTPLTLIIGPLEQIIQDQPPPSILKRRIQGVLKNSKHILGLVNQLLDLAKIESGQMKYNVVVGNIHEFTKELVENFKSEALKKNLQLIYQGEKEEWNTYFDKDKWHKTVYNLLSNALKFTPPGGKIQVCLMSAQLKNEDAIRLTVKDTGIGILKGDINQIFDRFYQADTSNVSVEPGTGIGLALVKELISLQNGEIDIFSEVDKGTTIVITIPVLDNYKAKSYTVSAKETTGVHDIGSRPIEETIIIEKLIASERLDLLIVEDNEEMRDYIHQCLGDTKYNIIESSNGEEGFEKAQAIIPDIIVSDVTMPKQSGFELTENIRSHTSTSHIPLILLTAKASLKSKMEGLYRGADAYLTKPFSPDELNLRIQKLVELRSAFQKRYQSHDHISEDETFKKEDEFITNLKTYILDNIEDQDLNGDRIGAHFALSRIHLYRKLKALTNTSITDYVKTMRLQKALALIKEGELNATEIAYQTGFSSLSHFSRSFKKEFGTSPSKM